MLAWLQQNWGTIVVVGVIAAIAVAIIVARIRGHKAGKSGCGCGCSGCALRDTCHPKTTPKNK